nr:catalase-like [Coffea arabica]XP_027071558.1 catalase-like [Coffea arabica]
MWHDVIGLNFFPAPFLPFVDVVARFLVKQSGGCFVMSCLLLFVGLGATLPISVPDVLTGRLVASLVVFTSHSILLFYSSSFLASSFVVREQDAYSPSRPFIQVLNKTIDNYFAETEQLAFNPAFVVPGIYYSDDKLLQTRIFAYGDTQRHRLGPNYMQLPVNAPKCAHHNNHYDDFMNFMHRDEEFGYFPSRFNPIRHAARHPFPSAVLRGKRDRVSFYE